MYLNDIKLFYFKSFIKRTFYSIIILVKRLVYIIILHKKYGLPLTMSETEMTEKLGYVKIYDCGLIKYVWKNT